MFVYLGDTFRSSFQRVIERSNPQLSIVVGLLLLGLLLFVFRGAVAYARATVGWILATRVQRVLWCSAGGAAVLVLFALGFDWLRWITTIVFAALLAGCVGRRHRRPRPIPVTHARRLAPTAPGACRGVGPRGAGRGGRDLPPRLAAAPQLRQRPGHRRPPAVRHPPVAAAFVAQLGAGAWVWAHSVAPCPSTPENGPHGGSVSHTCIIGEVARKVPPGRHWPLTTIPASFAPLASQQRFWWSCHGVSGSGDVRCVGEGRAPGQDVHGGDHLLRTVGLALQHDRLDVLRIELVTVGEVRLVDEVQVTADASTVTDPRVARGLHVLAVGELGTECDASGNEQLGRARPLTIGEPGVGERDDRRVVGGTVGGGARVAARVGMRRPRGCGSQVVLVRRTVVGMHVTSGHRGHGHRDDEDADRDDCGSIERARRTRGPEREQRGDARAGRERGGDQILCADLLDRVERTDEADGA